MDQAPQARAAKGQASLVGLLSLWYRRHTARTQLRHHLQDQPESVIRDAGFTPTELRRELSKPFWRG